MRIKLLPIRWKAWRIKQQNDVKRGAARKTGLREREIERERGKRETK